MLLQLCYTYVIQRDGEDNEDDVQRFDVTN